MAAVLALAIATTSCGDAAPDTIEVSSKRQALQCDPNAVSVASAITTLGARIPVIGDLFDVAGDILGLTEDLACEAQDLSEQIGVIARNEIEKKALTDLKLHLKNLAETMGSVGLPTPLNLNTWAGKAGEIETDAVAIGIEALPMLMGASTIKLATLREEMDRQETSLLRHSKAEEIRAAVGLSLSRADALAADLEAQLSDAQITIEDFRDMSDDVQDYEARAVVTYLDGTKAYTAWDECVNAWLACEAGLRDKVRADMAANIKPARDAEIRNRWLNANYQAHRANLAALSSNLMVHLNALNLARGRPTTQSSTYDGGISARAVDGNTNGSWAGASLTHTESEAAYWEVDLGRPQRIEGVVLYNRTDCCQERLRNFDVELYDARRLLVTRLNVSNVSDKAVFYLDFDGADGGFQASYLRVKLTSPGNLSLAEVYVHGTNRARARIATQSSVASNGDAARAVDGNVNGVYSAGLSQTGSSGPQYWEVDLGQKRAIGEVVLWNRTDSGSEQLANFDVQVIDATLSGGTTARRVEYTLFRQAAVGRLVTLDLGGYEGRIVRIQPRDQRALALAEVEIFEPHQNVMREESANFNDWLSVAKTDCAQSNMAQGGLAGYQTCLDQRQLARDDAYWQIRVTAHCDGSYYTGGKYSDYNAYWKCFADRGMTYSNNADWQNGVQSYCANSNAGIGFNGNTTCLGQREVSFSASAWCPAVNSYCRSQTYPFAWAGYTEGRCRSERRCY